MQLVVTAEQTDLRLYQERFPSRCMPNHQIFYRLHRHLSEIGSFITSTDGRGRSKTAQQTHLRYVDETPGKCTRAAACHLHTSQPSPWTPFGRNFQE
ncbi:hypothetical protein TNCV_4831611 [Trichonephila clavipes]|nr:hypothetical protein TNCV_4831611 [Trichonephila clavipes]